VNTTTTLRGGDDTAEFPTVAVPTIYISENARRGALRGDTMQLPVIHRGTTYVSYNAFAEPAVELNCTDGLKPTSPACPPWCERHHDTAAETEAGARICESSATPIPTVGPDGADADRTVSATANRSVDLETGTAYPAGVWVGGEELSADNAFLLAGQILRAAILVEYGKPPTDERPHWSDLELLALVELEHAEAYEQGYQAGLATGGAR
jgi:hypothetical protein